MASKLDFFTKLKKNLRKLKDFQRNFRKKLKVLPTPVDLACKKCPKKACLKAMTFFCTKSKTEKNELVVAKPAVVLLVLLVVVHGRGGRGQGWGHKLTPGRN